MIIQTKTPGADTPAIVAAAEADNARAAVLKERLAALAAEHQALTKPLGLGGRDTASVRAAAHNVLAVCDRLDAIDAERKALEGEAGGIAARGAERAARVEAMFALLDKAGAA